MKKKIIILAMLLSGTLSVDAQTYYYKYLYTVDKESGMKKNPGKGNSGLYITFSNGKSACYQSNKDGTLWRPSMPIAKATDDRIDVYNYSGSQNGMHIYRQTRIQGPYGLSTGGWGTYTFSQDYNRMNSTTTIIDANEVKVYERSTPPEEQSAPQQLY